MKKFKRVTESCAAIRFLRLRDTRAKAAQRAAAPKKSPLAWNKFIASTAGQRERPKEPRIAFWISQAFSIDSGTASAAQRAANSFVYHPGFFKSFYTSVKALWSVRSQWYGISSMASARAISLQDDEVQRLKNSVRSTWGMADRKLENLSRSYC